MRALGLLCSHCEKYASQDYGMLKEQLLPEDCLGHLAAHAASVALWEQIRNARRCRRIYKKFGLLHFARATRLSGRQWKVFRLRIFQQMSFGDISKTIGITKCCAVETYKRAIKNVQKRIPISLLRGIERDPLPFQEATISTPRPKFSLPKRRKKVIRSFCPRCRGLLASIGQDFSYCMDCGWTNDHDHF